MSERQKVYALNKEIYRSNEQIRRMIYMGVSDAMSNKHRSNRIEDMRLKIIHLTSARQNGLRRAYTNPDISADPRPQTHEQPSPSKKSPPQLAPIAKPLARSRSPVLPVKVTKVIMEKDRVIVEMQPQPDDQEREAEKSREDTEDDDIVYPAGVVDYRPYKTVARYRRATGKSINFRHEPLCVGVDQTETLLLGLEHFAEQHGCALNFTNKAHQFDNSIYRAACGVVDLGSFHLMATDSLLTAVFELHVDLDFNSDIARSEESVEQFVEEFCAAMADVLGCDKNSVRVFSINRLGRKKGKSVVHIGLTTADMKKTEHLAQELQVKQPRWPRCLSDISFQALLRDGFSKNTILRCVIPMKYEFKMRPALKFLKLQPIDLAPEHNFDYRQPGVLAEDTRGGSIYHLPIGWYRHAIRVVHKYGTDETWIGRKNASDEWAVAYHGTNAGAVAGIAGEGLRTNLVQRDFMVDEAVQQMGEAANAPGVYLATHCEGGSYPTYTREFTVSVCPGKAERFSLVFQCRVKPGTFTRHTRPVSKGEALRFVDPHSVRPYGILMKKET